MKLDEKELLRIQTAQKDFNAAKMTLADLVLNQQVVVAQIDEMREGYAKFEAELIEKYGADSSINTQTGEVTKKEAALEKV
jgi:hypothetical protein